MTSGGQPGGGTASARSLDDGGRDHRLFLGALLAVAVGTLWLTPLGQGLWIDELLTNWIVDDGIGDAIDRSARYQGQSPLYYAIAWVARRAGGGEEAILRLPSLLAVGLGGWMLWRLGSRLLCREAASISALVYTASAGVAFAAADARPYGVALAALIGSVLALVRWTEQRRLRDAVACVLTAAAVVYLHYLFALALLGHAAFLLARRRELRGAHAWVLPAGFAVLLLPLVPQALDLLSRRSVLAVPQPLPSPETLAGLLVPAPLMLGPVAGLAIARIAGPLSLHRVPMRGDLAALLGTWGLAAPAVPFIVSYVGVTRFTAPRYYLFVAPAVSLAAGWALASVDPPRARRAAMTAIVALAILSPGATRHSFEDWPGVARRLGAISDAGTIVLLDTHLVEARDPAFLSDPEKASYLLAPTARYPIEGSVQPMPYDLGGETQPYLDGLLDRLRAGRRFVLVQRLASDPFRAWLETRLASDGFAVERVAQLGTITIDLFERRAPGAPPPS